MRNATFIAFSQYFHTRKSILYCTGWSGQYIPYRPVHWYRYPYCFISEKILAVPASYRPCQQNPAVSAGKWIPGKDREIPKKNSHEFSELTQSCCTWLEPEPEPEPEPLRLLPLPTTQIHRLQPLKTQLTQPNHRKNTQPMNKSSAAVSPSSS